jgi:hypothetical protein
VVPDGSTAVKVIVNDQEVCSSNAIYGSSEGTREVEGKKWETISRMTECDGPIKVKKGDKFKLRAAYDVMQHPV